MSITGIISISITVAGFIGGIIATVAKLAHQTGRTMERVETNEKRDEEERAKTSAKFAELYKRISCTESDVNALQTNVNNIMGTCTRIENKLDRIIERTSN